MRRLQLDIATFSMFLRAMVGKLSDSVEQQAEKEPKNIYAVNLDGRRKNFSEREFPIRLQQCLTTRKHET